MSEDGFVMAGETRFERATGGFGDRCSTVEPLPCKTYVSLIVGLHSVKVNGMILPMYYK